MSVEREIGSLGATQKAQGREISELKKSFVEMDARLEKVEASAHRVRGGWWTISIVASVMAAMGAFLVRMGLSFGP